MIEKQKHFFSCDTMKKEIDKFQWMGWYKMRRMGQKIVLLVMAMFLMVSCTPPKKEGDEQIIKPVRVTYVQEETKNKTIRYTGNVVIKDTKTFAFKSPGKIASIPIKKGQFIESGDILAKLDTKDLEFAKQAAEGKVQAASSQYEKAVNGATKEDIEQLKINLKKAEDAFRYTDDLYQKMEELYLSGAVSQNERDKVRLERDVRSNEKDQAKVALQTAMNGTRKEDISAAQANLSMAQTELSYQQSQIEDAIILSDMEGYVAEIIQKEGAFVSAGYPVIALRGNGKVIKTGIARQDIDKIRLEGMVDIGSDESKMRGNITHISDIPDNYTRTYEIEITPEREDLSIGSIVELDLIIGSEKGIWIPMSSVLSEGKDYVYVVEQAPVQEQDSELNDGETIGEIRKQEIVIESTRGSYVKVKGLEASSALVVEGMRSIKENDRVKIIGEQP